jgi:hypothetical protein
VEKKRKMSQASSLKVKDLNPYLMITTAVGRDFCADMMMNAFLSASLTRKKKEAIQMTIVAMSRKAMCWRMAARQAPKISPPSRARSWWRDELRVSHTMQITWRHMHKLQEMVNGNERQCGEGGKRERKAVR